MNKQGIQLSTYIEHTRGPVAKLAKSNGVQNGVLIVKGLNGDQDPGGGVLLVVKRRGDGIELPATVDDVWKLADRCCDRLVANDQAHVHCICEFWTKMNADSYRDAALALCWSVAEDMDETCGRDDGVIGRSVWDCRGRHGRGRQRERKRGSERRRHRPRTIFGCAPMMMNARSCLYLAPLPSHTGHVPRLPPPVPPQPNKRRCMRLARDHSGAEHTAIAQ